MKAIEWTIILSILLLLRVEYLVARPTAQNITFEGSNLAHTTQSTETTIENNILKGPVLAIDDRKIGAIIFDVLSADPEHISQIDAVTGNQITFREMKDRSIRLALWIKELGIGPTDIVVECSQNHVDSYVPLFATFFVDAIFSAWHPNPSLEKAQHLMREYSPKLMFSDEASADMLLKAATLEDSKVKIVVFGKHSSLQSLNETLSVQTDENIKKFTLVNEKNPEETAVILTTSGSTGFPKGVLLSGKSVSTIARGFHGFHSTETLKVLWYTNLGWISCLRHTLQTIVQKNVIVVPSTFDDPDQTLRIIEKYNIGAVRLNKLLIHLIAKTDLAKNYNLQSLKILLVSGGKISLSVFEQLQRKLPNTFIQYVYGVTELGGKVTETMPNEKLTGSVGYVIPNAQVKFVDPKSGTTLGPKQSGEIYAKSSTMMIEYYKNPEATKQAIDTEGWYHTGDVGYYAENGEIFVLGRLKDIIKYRNHSIMPSEIEEILLSHPDVEDAVIVSIPREVDGDWPAAFVKKLPGSKVSKEDLIKLMAVHEDYKQLRGGIYFLENYPDKGSPKVAKDELVKIAESMARLNAVLDAAEKCLNLCLPGAATPYCHEPCLFAIRKHLRKMVKGL